METNCSKGSSVLVFGTERSILEIHFFIRNKLILEEEEEEEDFICTLRNN